MKVPQVRGTDDTQRLNLWAKLAPTSARLSTFMVAMFARGMSQRDIALGLEKARGQFVLSKGAISTMTATLSQEYEAFRARDLSGYDVASLFMDTVYAPLRRWGSKTGVVCVWGICVDGRKVFLTLSTANSESYEACLDVLRALVTRGLPTPVTITTDGAPGLIKAVEYVWPRSLRLRCWFHKRQNLMQQVPPHAWPEFKARVNDVRDAPTFAEGQRRLDTLLAQHQAMFPEACRCWADDTRASLHHWQVPLRHRQ